MQVVKRVFLLAWVVLCGAAAILSAAEPRVARDWAQFPAVVQIDHADEIFAIGDAHSDFKQAMTRAGGSGAASFERPVDHPEEAKWHAGKNVLVTTGDMIDKGPRALDVLRLLKWVRTGAQRAGGTW